MKTSHILACVASLAAASAADAAVYTLTFGGQITSSTLNVAAFGFTIGTDLAGVSYDLIYTIDDGLSAGHYYYNAQGSAAFGGAYNFPDGLTPITATLRINGVSQQFGGGFTSSMVKDTCVSIACTGNQRDGRIYATTTDRTQMGFDSSIRSTNSGTYYSLGLSNPDWRDIGTFQNIAAFTGTGTGSAEDYRIINNSVVYNYRLTLTPQTLTIAAAAVPEPASWALTIAGFGLAGGALRHRSAKKGDLDRAVA